MSIFNFSTRNPRGRGKWNWAALLLVLSLLPVTTGWARDAEIGVGQVWWVAGGEEIAVFTYRPPTCAKPSILFVFHGLNRKAAGVRRKAMDVAEQACLMVFAPLFDKARFPNWRYHRAGVVRDGRVQPADRWTAPVVRDLLDLSRRLIANPEAKVYLFGHSAGGQFLSRVAAYAPLHRVDRIVIANPSVYVTPSMVEAPYGFGGVFAPEEAQSRLKAYLALPVTIYLGEEDTGERYLVKTSEAMRLGKNRRERGRAVYHMAEALARERGWPFGWTLVEASGVGHSSGGMLRNAAMLPALGLSP